MKISMGDYVVDCLSEGCGWHVEGQIRQVLLADIKEHLEDSGHSKDDIGIVRTGGIV